MAETDSKREAQLEAFQHRLGVKFNTIDLLERALTHKSVPHAPHYERLEFLGDRLLGYVIAEMLYTRFPEESEGGLSIRLAKLVSRDALFEIAEPLGIDQVVRLQPQLRDLRFGKSRTLIADVVEALIAALYLDSGGEAMRAFIERHWRDTLEQNSDLRDARALLQEWCQKHKMPLPHYEVSETTGLEHDLRFTIIASVPTLSSGEKVCATARARSKKIAMREAAHILLEKVVPL